MNPRYYQVEAVAAVYNHLYEKETNPCVVIPTGGGKSLTMATICRDAVTRWNGRGLVMAHVKELLEQTAGTLRRLAPDVPVGIYSAGLGSRDIGEPVIVAGIQSVHRKADVLGHFDLILIDECHLLPEDGEGMYRTFLQTMKTINPRVRLIGFTATPYRMKSGMLCGPDNLLNEICYEIGVKELIVRGYLCPLKSRGSELAVDTSELHLRGGEFVPAEVDALMGAEAFEKAACQEIVQRTKDRNNVLVFAASVERAEVVCRLLQSYSGAECAVVTGETPASERDLLLRRFKNEKVSANLLGDTFRPLKYLVNVNVLTTGFDAPNVDCIVLLRPTASPGLYYQMIGRGFRVHESKKETLVLDYGNNIVRHGPVDSIKVDPAREKGTGAAPAKECPKCHFIMHAAISVCSECGFEFPKREITHETTASVEGIISGEVTDTTYSVIDIEYTVHQKNGAHPGDPRSVRVDYVIQRGHGYQRSKSEWVCPEHSGWARKKFEDWWKKRSNAPPPDSADEAVDIARSGGLLPSAEIVVRKVAGEKYDKIIQTRIVDQLGPQTSPVTHFGKTCGMCSHYAYGFCLEKQQENILETASACESFAEIDLDDVPF